MYEPRRQYEDREDRRDKTEDSARKMRSSNLRLPESTQEE